MLRDVTSDRVCLRIIPFPPTADPASISPKDLAERMLFVEALETVRCWEEGVIESVADANVGSILGIGHPG